jgi:hypothetical protein
MPYTCGLSESTLLKSLGIFSENLSAREDMMRFKELFDSAIRDTHMQGLSAIFGKALPTNFERS